MICPSFRLPFLLLATDIERCLRTARRQGYRDERVMVPCCGSLLEVRRPPQGPESRREEVLLKSASLRGRRVWSRRSERQAGDVTPAMALTDEFTCGHKKRAFQEQRQCVPKARTQEESRVPCSWTWRGCICWEGVSPREWQQGLTAQSDQEAKIRSTLPGKHLARSSSALIQRNLETSHTPTAQLEGDMNQQRA